MVRVALLAGAGDVGRVHLTSQFAILGMPHQGQVARRVQRQAVTRHAGGLRGGLRRSDHVLGHAGQTFQSDVEREAVCGVKHPL